MAVSRADNRRLIKRKSGEIRRYRIWMRILPLGVAVLTIILVIVYIASALYIKFGSFTVMINKLDKVKYALTLSETPDFTNATSRLNSKASQNITNISINDLPDDLDNINGEHNGNNYVAYTFYMKNAGKLAVDVEYQIYIANMTLDIEKAVRVRLYSGPPDARSHIDYARTATDGSGPEPGTTEFLTETTIVKKVITSFAPEEVEKFTVVIWLEGDDPDCIDDIIGGQFKIDMLMTILNVDAEDT